ncbi:hypothetical protein SLA_5809 [Streptomyces laurentii]|uniref:Uncharacterized protein n=1 Tax=Streptomyces laurentii TaxID=39478 RepID=A0A169P748_STRLU|nr:hypothetical protein SLA_5809 [Streptomyces laurentii]
MRGARSPPFTVVAKRVERLSENPPLTHEFDHLVSHVHLAAFGPRRSAPVGTGRSNRSRPVIVVRTFTGTGALPATTCAGSVGVRGWNGNRGREPRRVDSGPWNAKTERHEEG